MKIQIITLFPDIFEGVFSTSMMKKASDIGAVELSIIDLRNYGIGPRKQVDDTLYGGGDGMLLKPEPLFAAIEQAKQKDTNAKVYLMTPRGVQYKQAQAQAIAGDSQGMIIVCARYEGYDERVTTIVDEQVSIGDYVLTGGEVPAMVVADSVIRLLPNVLGGEMSAEKESFTDSDIIEHPQYTRPDIFRGMSVPEVLKSGNHKNIEAWRQDNSKQNSA